MSPTLMFLRNSFKSRELLTFSGHLRVGKQSLGFAEAIGGRGAFIGLCLKSLTGGQAIGRPGSKKLGNSTLGEKRGGIFHIPPPNKSEVDAV